MGAARASQPGMKAVTIYMPDDLWDWLRRHTYDEGTSASALLRAKAEEHQAATAAKRKPALERAREITIGQRRRSGADG